MMRHQLEHIIRAAAGNADVRDFVIIGSQSILGSHPDAPDELTVSMEEDVFPRDAPERSILIDGAIGELSMFHETFGHYAHGVDETTAILPEGWKERLVKVADENTMGAVGWCLEVHDLAVSKLMAAREKDLVYVDAMLRNKLITVNILRDRLKITPEITLERREVALARLQRWENKG